MRRLIAIAIGLWVATGVARSQTEITSSFDSNTEGWTCNNATAEWRSRGAGLGGYLFIDNPENTVSHLIAPAKFLGNRSAFEGGVLSFSGNLLEALDRYWQEGEGMNYGTITISGPGGTATKDIVQGQPPTNQWIGYELLLIHDTFGITREQWQAILANVTSITVNLEAIYGREMNGFDNFSLRTATAGLTVSPHTTYIFYTQGESENAISHAFIRVQSGIPFEITSLTQEGLPKLDAIVWTNGAQFTQLVRVKPFGTLAPGRHNITLRIAVPGRPTTEVPVIIDVGRREEEVAVRGFGGSGFVNPSQDRYVCTDANTNVTSPAGGAQITQRPDPSAPGCEKKFQVKVDPLFRASYLRIIPPGTQLPVLGAPNRPLVETPPVLTLFTNLSNPSTVEKNVHVTNASGRDITLEARVDQPAGKTALSVPGTGIFTIPAGGSAEVPVQFNPTGLGVGPYQGTLRFFEGNQPIGSTVIYAAVSASTSVRSNVYGTQFFAGSGTPAQPKKIVLENPSASAVSFGTKVGGPPGGGSFQVTPGQGTIPARGKTELTVQPPAGGGANASGVLGVYDADKPSNEWLWIYQKERYGAPPPPVARAVGNCTPAELLMIFTAPGLGFAVHTGETVPLGLDILDDCGVPLEAGQVSVEFGNGDAAVDLFPVGGGQWAGAWRPREAEQAAVTLQAIAFSADGKLFGLESFALEIAAGDNPPPLFETRSVANAASQLPSRPLSGGEIISIYGDALASSAANAPSLPLPTTLGGASVNLGGVAAPLLYAGPTQINAVVPYGLPQGTPLPLIVRRGDSLSFPAPVVLASTSPAVFTLDLSGTGQGIITNLSFQLYTAANPAKAGDPLVIFLGGLGETDPTVPAGQAASNDPLSFVKAEVSVTVGGLPAQFLYAVLAPGFAGLYQAAAIVPPGVAAGNAVPVVVTAGGFASPPVTIAVQ